MEWKTEDLTAQFEPADISGNRLKAACSYLGVFVLVPLLMAKKSWFARFHANQGLALLVAGLIYNLMVGILTVLTLGVSLGLYPVLRVVHFLGLFFPVFTVIGIWNAASGKAKELPVIGKIRLIW